MENNENGDDDEHSQSSSAPPTPPSPLPISVGPGNQKYFFSPSPSPSPPFSSHASTENLPLLPEKLLDSEHAPLAFSVERPAAYGDDELGSAIPSCLKDLLEWFIQRCCSCCSISINPSANTAQKS